MTEDLITLLADLDDEENPVVDENLQMYLERCEEYTGNLRCRAMLESVYELLPLDDTQNREKIMSRIDQQDVWLKYVGSRVVRIAYTLGQYGHRKDKLQLRAARRHFHKGNISCADLYAQNIVTHFAGTWELKEWVKERVDDRMYDRKSEMSIYRGFGGTFLSTAITCAKNTRPNSSEISNRYFAAAIKCFEEAAAIMRGLANRNDDSGFFHQILVEVTAELAAAHRRNNDGAAEERHLLEAIYISRKMFENKDHYYYLPDLVSLLEDLARLCRKIRTPETGETFFTEKLEFYESFAEAHRWEHRSPLGRLMSLLADFYRVDKPDREKSISLAVEAVVLIEYPKDTDFLAAKTRAIEILKEWEIPDDELELLLKQTWHKRNPDSEEPCPELRQLLAAEPAAQDFAALLYRLPEYETPAPKDQKNLDTYLSRCPEYTLMREHLDRLNAILHNLPSRTELYYEGKIAEEIRHLEFRMQSFRSHVVEIAKRLNGGSPGSLTHSEEARAYFESYQVLEAGVYSFAFYSDEDVLTDTLESHLRNRAEREEELAVFFNRLAQVFLKSAISDSSGGLVESAERYFNAATLADAGVTEGVVLPDSDPPVEDTPAPLPYEPSESPKLVEDFVSLLGHLNTTPSRGPEDDENFNRYLENCPEYTKMQSDLARLNSIFPHLKVPDDKENRLQVMVNANKLTSEIKEFKERVLKTAHRIAAGDREKEPAVWRAAECFNGFYMDEAEFFAFPDTPVTDQWSYQELENEWGRYVDDRFRWGPAYDPMGELFKKLADDFLELAYEKTTSTDAAVLEDAERYYKASIRALAARTNLVCYGVFLENNYRSVEASQIFRRVLDNVELDTLDTVTLQHLLGRINWKTSCTNTRATL